MSNLAMAASEVVDAYNNAEELDDIGGAMERLDEAVTQWDRFPRIVCLCGSTRYYRTFQEANYRETMAGNIVLSVGFYPHSSEQAHGESVGITSEQKEELDRLHFRKIELADEILVLNVDGYIGKSTRNELNYARSLGKIVTFWEEETAPND